MICVVVALPSEARPLIREFGLERVGEGRPAVWRGPDVLLCVSGIGRIAADSAVRRLAADWDPPGSAWLNVGIGGHRIVLAREVADATSGRVRPLRPIAPAPCATATVTTVDRPELDYPDETVYEMEAAGFCSAAAGLASLKRIQVVKVISDNPTAPPDGLTAERVEELITGRIDTVARIVETLAAPGAL